MLSISQFKKTEKYAEINKRRNIYIGLGIWHHAFYMLIKIVGFIGLTVSISLSLFNLGNPLGVLAVGFLVYFIKKELLKFKHIQNFTIEKIVFYGISIYALFSFYSLSKILPFDLFFKNEWLSIVVQAFGVSGFILYLIKRMIISDLYHHFGNEMNEKEIEDIYNFYSNEMNFMDLEDSNNFIEDLIRNNLLDEEKGKELLKENILDKKIKLIHLLLTS